MTTVIIYLFCTIVQDVVINMVIDILNRHNCITLTGTSKKGIKCLSLDLTKHLPGGIVVPWLLTIIIHFKFVFKFRVIYIGDRNLLEGYFHINILRLWFTTVGHLLDLPEGRSMKCHFSYFRIRCRSGVRVCATVGIVAPAP